MCFSTINVGTEEVRERMVVGPGAEGFETVDMASKGGKRLIGANLPAVGGRDKGGVGQGSGILLGGHGVLREINGER